MASREIPCEQHPFGLNPQVGSLCLKKLLCVSSLFLQGLWDIPFPFNPTTHNPTLWQNGEFLPPNHFSLACWFISWVYYFAVHQVNYLGGFPPGVSCFVGFHWDPPSRFPPSPTVYFEWSKKQHWGKSVVECMYVMWDACTKVPGIEPKGCSCDYGVGWGGKHFLLPAPSPSWITQAPWENQRGEEDVRPHFWLASSWEFACLLSLAMFVPACEGGGGRQERRGE